MSLDAADSAPSGEGVGGRSEAVRPKEAVVHVLGQVQDVPGIAGKAAKSAQSLAEPLVVDDSLDQSEKLKAMPEWVDFTPLQKEIVTFVLLNPLAKNQEIAEGCKCSVGTVIRTRHSAAYEKVMDELAKVEKSSLRFAAMDVMRKLLTADKESVRLDAAKSILKDAGMLTEPEKKSTKKTQLEVTWKGFAPPKP